MIGLIVFFLFGFFVWLFVAKSLQAGRQVKSIGSALYFLLAVAVIGYLVETPMLLDEKIIGQNSLRYSMYTAMHRVDSSILEIFLNSYIYLGFGAVIFLFYYLVKLSEKKLYARAEK